MASPSNIKASDVQKDDFKIIYYVSLRLNIRKPFQLGGYDIDFWRKTNKFAILMTARSYKHIISIFLIAVILCKGLAVTSAYVIKSLKLTATELSLETEEEKKGSAKDETGNEKELFGKALLPADDLILFIYQGKQLIAPESIFSVFHPDTLTPPPNFSAC